MPDAAVFDDGVGAVRFVSKAFCVRKVAEFAEAADIIRLSDNLDATWQAAKDREI